MNSHYAGQHQPDFSNASHWLLVDVLRKLAVVVLCGLLLLIAGRELSNALDDLAPPPGSARSAVDSEAPPSVSASVASPAPVRTNAGATPSHP